MEIATAVSYEHPYNPHFPSRCRYKCMFIITLKVMLKCLSPFRSFKHAVWFSLLSFFLLFFCSEIAAHCLLARALCHKLLLLNNYKSQYANRLYFFATYLGKIWQILAFRKKVNIMVNVRKWAIIYFIKMFTFSRESPI